MDPFVMLLCWQFVLFSLAIAGVTYPIRLLIEFIVPLKTVSFWTDVVLPTLPIASGAIMAYFVSLPFPEGITTTSAHVCWGLVAGMFSSIMFRITKAVFRNNIQAAFMRSKVVKSTPKSPIKSGNNLGRPRKPRKHKNK